MSGHAEGKSKRLGEGPRRWFGDGPDERSSTRSPRGRYNPLARRSLAEAFDPRDNALGLFRLLFASSVIVAHAYPLSGRGPDPLVRLSDGQATLGGFAVTGFFIVSGFLVIRSALRASTLRYVWRRFVRIFPGFWVCLIVTASVFAPAMWLYENGITRGFLRHDQGPLSYMYANVATGMNQYGISGLLVDTPYGDLVGASVFDGSLWTLIYEVGCYVVVGIVALTIVRRQARYVVPFITGVLLVATILFAVGDPSFEHHIFGPAPLLGAIDLYYVVTLGLAFALGAVLELYKEHVPVTDVLGLIGLTAFAAAIAWNGFIVVGPIAMAYTIFWIATRAPPTLRGIGRRNDYSYGIYIYAFPVQQMLAAVGLATPSLALFIALTFLATVPLAALSWHLVEHPALRKRDLDLRAFRLAPSRSS